jgi:arginyl-tRNA synthetase
VFNIGGRGEVKEPCGTGQPCHSFNMSSPLEGVKAELVRVISSSLERVFHKELSIRPDVLVKPIANHGDVSLPCYRLVHHLKPESVTPVELAKRLFADVKEQDIPNVRRVELVGAHINFYVTTECLASIVESILDGTFLQRQKSGKERVMIEYSQPNTHKAFHVGHMRNVALGDFFCRAYHHLGYDVVPVNYFGDEGAHVAKCLWWLQKTFLKDHHITDLPEPCGETLGLYYQQAVAALDRESAIKEHQEVRETLIAMESKEPAITELWNITKQMSLDEFRDIYDWLGCRFEHDFYESDMTSQSKQMVLDMFNKGLLVKDNGAIGADLTPHGLGFLVLLKSDGTTLYATKDLALAVKKFEEFKIDRSIYVVDAAQSTHFAQVFKTLELMGYEKARQCRHVPYGRVVSKSRLRMSSRDGTVVYFSTLRDELYASIDQEFLSKRKDWPEAELAGARHAIALASIKYGMLNTDSAKDIMFDLKAWTSAKGNTGPYLLYAVTRILKILADVALDPNALVDYSHLSHQSEHEILVHMGTYWQVVGRAVHTHNAGPLCTFVYDLARAFCAWYELPGKSIKHAENIHIQATRLKFVHAIGEVLQSALNLLGIDVLARM